MTSMLSQESNEEGYTMLFKKKKIKEKKIGGDGNIALTIIEIILEIVAAVLDEI